MSGIFKAIGKVFKSVVKVLKKVALPALVIGAVVLTGGAALGVLPAIAGAGGLGASLGLSAGLSGVLSAAATSATLGFAGGLLTGQDPIKAGTIGLITGGVLGGASALTGIGSSVAGGAAAGSSAAGNAASSFGQTIAGAGGAITPAAAAVAPLASTAAGIVPAAAGGIFGQGGIISGIGRFINANPVVSGQIINGIGGGLAQGQAAKDARNEALRIEGNYANPVVFRTTQGATGAAYAPPGASAPQTAMQPVGTGTQYDYDPRSGRIVPRQQAAA